MRYSLLFLFAVVALILVVGIQFYVERVVAQTPIRWTEFSFSDVAKIRRSGESVLLLVEDVENSTTSPSISAEIDSPEVRKMLYRKNVVPVFLDVSEDDFLLVDKLKLNYGLPDDFWAHSAIIFIPNEQDQRAEILSDNPIFADDILTILGKNGK